MTSPLLLSIAARGLRLVRFVVFPIVVSPLAGCASAPRPCVVTEGCPGAQVCQVGRCTLIDELPAQIEARRRVIEPTEARYVDGASGEGAPELRLGSQAAGGAVLLVRYEADLGPGEIESAFLLLDPVEGAPPSATVTEISVSPVLEPWGPAGDGARLPRVGAPEARALLSFSPPRAFRVDVTALVKAWSRGTSGQRGLALHAPRGSGLGARFGWADAGGTGPRLDVYLRPAPEAPKSAR